jgi:hypothetical protein
LDRIDGPKRAGVDGTGRRSSRDECSAVHPRWSRDRGSVNGPPDEGPGDVAGLFELERARLLELLGTVADDEWAAPTPCPEWTVLGLCCHLVGDDFATLSWHRDRYWARLPAWPRPRG